MNRKIISILFLFIISFHVLPIDTILNWNQIEMAQDMLEDDVEKSEAKSKKFESCHSLFLECAITTNKNQINFPNFEMGKLSLGHTTSTFIPPNVKSV